MKNQRGFSLVELMVVVGIIATLTMLAVPSYKGFQARARQKEGFGLLNAYHMAAHNAKTEFGFFPGSFVQIGFRPAGQLMYRLTAAFNRRANMTAFDDDCWDTSRPCNCAGVCPEFKNWDELPLGAVGVSLGPDPAVGPCPTPVSVTDSTFQIVVAGVIDYRSSRADRYTMNNFKQLVMCADGIN